MRVEVLSGVERRRQWSDGEKARIIEETLAPGARVSEVARRNAVSASLVFSWRRLARDGLLGRGVPALMPVEDRGSGSRTTGTRAFGGTAFKASGRAH